MPAAFTAIGPLSATQVRSALRAAVAAPSLHNSQPWQFVCTPTAISMRARALPTLRATDRDGRLLLLACGAALLNLRLAILAEGVNPVVQLLPDGDDPELIAVVRPQGMGRPSPVDRALTTAIPNRRTNRRPFQSDPVPEQVVNALRRAARLESCWLTTYQPAVYSSLRSLLTQAHRAQLADPAFVKEWKDWTGRSDHAVDGVPARNSGPLPEPQDKWVLRDFSAGTASPRVPGKDFESDPLLVAIESFNDVRLAQLNAGQAMQRVLLTATAHGLTASFLSQLIEREESRSALRKVSDRSLWPQMVLRVGYGSAASATPRRPLDEVVHFVADSR